jgi:hypothetical protein
MEQELLQGVLGAMRETRILTKTAWKVSSTERRGFFHGDVCQGEVDHG